MRDFIRARATKWLQFHKEGNYEGDLLHVVYGHRQTSSPWDLAVHINPLYCGTNVLPSMNPVKLSMSGQLSSGMKNCVCHHSTEDGHQKWKRSEKPSSSPQPLDGHPYFVDTIFLNSFSIKARKLPFLAPKVIRANAKPQHLEQPPDDESGVNPSSGDSTNSEDSDDDVSVNHFPLDQKVL